MKFLSGELGNVRIGYLMDYAGLAVNEEVDRSFKAALRVLEKAGASLSGVSIAGLKRVNAIKSAIIGSESTFTLWENVKDRVNELDREPRTYLMKGALLTATDYLRAQKLRTVVTQEMIRTLRRYDILASPTTPITAPKMGAKTEILRGKERSVPDLVARFTGIYNITGFPAISIPSGFDAKRLPIGLQLAGRPFEEGLVLKVAHRYQTRTPWHKTRPPL